jgi:hypothetical protein
MICTTIINLNKIAKLIKPENKFTCYYNKIVERTLNAIQEKDIESCKQFMKMLIVGYAMFSLISYHLYWKYLGTYNKETSFILAFIFLFGLMMTREIEFEKEKEKLFTYFKNGTFIMAGILIFSYCLAIAIAQYFKLEVQEDFMFKIAEMNGYAYAVFLIILFIFLLKSYILFLSTDLFIRVYKKLNGLFLRRSNSGDTAIAIIDIIVFGGIPLLIKISTMLIK